MLTKESFQKWLESKSLDEIVGTTREPMICPIATYLKENGAESIGVGAQARYCVDGEVFKIRSPWIKTFVSNIDRLVAIYGPYKLNTPVPTPQQVDAATCLKTLMLKTP